MKTIFILEASAPWTCVLGIFSSKEKANNAWRRWKRLHKNTAWENARKILKIYTIDKLECDE
jgi:hypothetical protein